MNKPEAYGAFHIITTLILLSLSLFLAWHFRKSNDKQNRLILGITSGALLLLEIYKIAFHIVINPYGHGFWGVFPFQLCSLPLYLGLFISCCKNEKINQWLYDCIFAVNFIGGIISFIEPSGIHHEYITLTMHAYIWHMSLIFMAVYLFLSGRVCNDLKGYFRALAVFACGCFLAQFFNVIFSNKPNVNCYYISPYNVTPLAVFKDVYVNYGWFANFALYLLGISIGAALLYYGGYFLNKRLTKQNIKTLK